MIIVLGGCSEAVEQGCISTYEYFNKLSEGFKLTEFKLNIPRRAPAIFKLDEKNIICVIGGCSAQMVHQKTIEIMNLNTTKKLQWKLGFNKEELNEGFSCAAFCKLKSGQCFIAGGYNGIECLNSVYIIEQDLKWIKLKNLPTKLKNSVAISIINKNSAEEKILLFGGWDEKRTLRTIFEYSLNGTNCCRLTALMPFPLEGHTVTRINNQYALICGGYDGISVIDKIFCFEFDEMKMRQISTKLKTARENHCAEMFNEENLNYLIIIGGWDGSSALKNCEVFQIIDDDVGKNVSLKFFEGHKLQLTTPRNKPVSINL